MTPTTPPPVPLAVRGMILDVDGTLVLSNDAHAHAWSDALQAFGHDISFTHVRPLMGMGGDQLLPRLIPGLQADSQDGKAITSRRKAIFLQQYMPQLRAAPGARALVSQLQERGVRLIVGSSAANDELEHLLAIAQVDDLLPDRTTADDAKQTKPAPDLVQVALQRLELPSHEVAMLGDSPYDITAAQQSGVQIIALRCGGFTDEELAGAYAIYADPNDLLAHLDTVLGPKRVPSPTTDVAYQQVPNSRGDEDTVV